MGNREQILNVLFSSQSQLLKETETQLDENVFTNVAQNVGTAIKHKAQNVVNDVRNSFAITAKQKAQANARTQALQNAQAAEKAGNKQIQQAGKAGKKSYKDIMANWSQANVKSSMEKALSKDATIKDIIEALEYGLCSINVLGVGGDNNINQSNALSKLEKDGNKASQNMVQDKNQAVNQALNGGGQNE